MTDTNRQLIDLGTGQIYDMTQYSLRSKRQDEAFKRTQYYQKDNRHFSFADMENIKFIISNIKTVHCGYLLILQCYMEYRTGKLTITRKEMPKAVGASESTFIRFWKEMQCYGIITEMDGEFYVNPYFHFRQKQQHNRVIKLFSTRIK